METGQTTELDAEGNAVLTLERKSVQTFRTQDEYLYAMKEDLAEWINTLYQSELQEEDFFEHLETGVLLCEHANSVNDFIWEKIQNEADAQQFQKVQYKTNAKAGSFQSRDNISNFIGWCRWTLSIPDTLLFESDDLVMRKNERNVVLCMLEVARRGARYGMLAPILVQLEVEIDAEIAGEEPPPMPQPTRPRRTIDMMSLDEMVREIAKQCTCPDTFPIIRLSEGKYQVGESLTLIFVRILRNHVMVRIGGGWDTLENYLNRHDPCRCNVSKNHKSRRFSHAISTNTRPTRRSSVPSQTPAQTLEVTRSRQLPATPVQSLAPKTVERLRQSDENPTTNRSNIASNRPQSPAKLKQQRPQSPALSRRPQSPVVSRKRVPSPPQADSSTRRQSLRSNTDTPTGVVNGAGTPRVRRLSLTSDNIQKQYRGNSSLGRSLTFSVKDPESVRPQPKRPGSAGPSAHSKILSRDNSIKERGRSPTRKRSTTHVRSHSVGASELHKDLLRASAESKDVLVAIRDKSGSHSINKSEDLNSKMSATTANTARGAERAFSSSRFGIATDNLLPSKPKTVMRSQSSEWNGMSERQDSGESLSSGSSGASERPVLRRQASVSSVGSLGSTIEDLNIPAPAPDHQMNEHMERLFEEYRRVEKGWFKCDDPELSEAADADNARKSSASKQPRPTSGRPRNNISNSQQSVASTDKQTPSSSRRTSLSASSSSSSLSGVMSRARPSTPTSSRRPTSSASSRATPPSTPTPHRRSATPVRPTPVRPTPIRPTPVYPQTSVNQDTRANTNTTSSQSTRSSSVRRDNSASRFRSQTPNPETKTPQTQTRARPKTPLVNLRTEEVKPRIDTGLRKRSTTPLPDSNSSNTSGRRNAGDMRRSASFSSASIIKRMSNDSKPEITTTPRTRSRSREDLLDGASSERKSRTDTVRKRDIVQNSNRRSASREINHVPNPVEHQNLEINANDDVYSQPPLLNMTHEPRRCLPPTPGSAPVMQPVTVEIPVNTLEYPEHKLSNPALLAKPRKDEPRRGPQTRIPRPASAQDDRLPDDAGSLKRFDSGVDINISPTESSCSGLGDNDMCLPWQLEKKLQAASLAPQPNPLPYSMSNDNDNYDEYY